MQIRKAQSGDLASLLALYGHLHHNEVPPPSPALDGLWREILADPRHHVILGLVEGVPVSSCVLVVVPNLTHNQRPYALVENVITHPGHRRRGYAARVLGFAKELAVQAGCYKIMLMTGARDEATLRVYTRAGYNAQDKTAFIQWL